MKIKAVNTILYCKKWQETIAFYRDGIQLLVLSSNEWFVEFKLNEMSRLSVADESRTSVKSGDGKGITVSIQINDVEQTLDELAKAGIQSTPIKEVWGSKAIYVRDPEGNRLEFWEGRAKAERSGWRLGEGAIVACLDSSYVDLGDSVLSPDNCSIKF